MNKEEIREEMLAQRKIISSSERIEKSAAINDKLYLIKEFYDAKSVFCYIDNNNEVETKELIKGMLHGGKEVASPVTDMQKKQIKSVKLIDIPSCRPGAFDILEPQLMSDNSNLISPETIDCVIVPGAAFDRTGGRIGYGGGFYDKYFSRAPEGIFRIGLAFDFQLLSKLTLEPHDIKMNAIVTNKEVLLLPR